MCWVTLIQSSLVALEYGTTPDRFFVFSLVGLFITVWVFKLHCTYRKEAVKYYVLKITIFLELCLCGIFLYVVSNILLFFWNPQLMFSVGCFIKFFIKLIIGINSHLPYLKYVVIAIILLLGSFLAFLDKTGEG